jgi:hypothetical protein
MSIAQNFPALKPSLLLDFSNTEALDSRVTFARASTATYYGTQTAKAEENLLLQSEEFESPWAAPSGISVVPDAATAPDGTTTADSLVATTVSTSHRVYQAFTANTSLPYTISAYVKDNGIDQVLVRTGATNSDANGVLFDLTLAIASNVGIGATSSSITDVGNSWYRIVATFTPTATSCNVYFGLAEAGTTTFTGDDTSSIYIWGAQLEQRDTVTAYTPTTTQPITNYIPVLETAAAGVARFDHNPITGESLGLLIEEQRTNLLTYSEDFSNAAWTKTNATISANTVVAPDGTLSADKLVENTTADVRHTVQQAQTLGVATYTGSFYAKAGERTRVAARRTSTDTTAFGVTFDLISGVVVSTLATTATITPVGNGWYRCSFQMVHNSASSAGFHIELIKEGEAASGAQYTGDGYSGIYIWGAQLE